LGVALIKTTKMQHSIENEFALKKNKKKYTYFLYKFFFGQLHAFLTGFKRFI